MSKLNIYKIKTQYTYPDYIVAESFGDAVAVLYKHDWHRKPQSIEFIGKAITKEMEPCK